MVVPPDAVAQKTSAYEQAILDIQQKIQARDFDAARASIAASAATYPHNGGIENLLGVLEIQQGNSGAAIKAFSAAIADSPRLLSPYLNLSRIRMEKASDDKSARASALQLSLKALQLDPRNDEAQYQAATILFWNKEYRASLEHLSALSTESRRQIGAESLACADRSATGDLAAASRSVDEMAENPDLTEQDAGTCLEPLRQARRADLIDRLYSAVAARRPLSAPGLRILGLAQEAEGKLQSARDTLEKAFSADSSSTTILEDLTRVALASKDNQGALGYLAHARELNPQKSGYAYEFGVICARMGLYAEARKALEEALRIDPDNAQYNLGMGMVVSFSEDPSQALPYLTHYHSLRPGDPEGVLALGTTDFRAKDYDEAAKWLRQAASSPNTAAEAHLFLGRIARQEGNLEQAASELNESLTLQPNQPDALAELGQINLAAHKFQQAEDNFGRALRNDPDNYAANFGLLQLYARTGDARREQQSRRFDEIKNLRDERDRQMMRAIEIRPDGTSNRPE